MTPARQRIAHAAFVEGAMELLRRALANRLAFRLNVSAQGGDGIAELVDDDGTVLNAHHVAGVQLALPLAAAAPAVEPATTAAAPVEPSAPKPCVRCGGKRSIETRCADPQCGDSTWDHECGDGYEPCPDCSPVTSSSAGPDKAPSEPAVTTAAAGTSAPTRPTAGDRITLDGVEVELLGTDDEGFIWRTVEGERDEGDTEWKDVEHVEGTAWRTRAIAALGADKGEPGLVEATETRTLFSVEVSDDRDDPWAWSFAEGMCWVLGGVLLWHIEGGAKRSRFHRMVSIVPNDRATELRSLLDEASIIHTSEVLTSGDTLLRIGSVVRDPASGAAPWMVQSFTRGTQSANLGRGAEMKSVYVSRLRAACDGSDEFELYEPPPPRKAKRSKDKPEKSEKPSAASDDDGTYIGIKVADGKLKKGADGSFAWLCVDRGYGTGALCLETRDLRGASVETMKAAVEAISQQPDCREVRAFREVNPQKTRGVGELVAEWKRFEGSKRTKASKTEPRATAARESDDPGIRIDVKVDDGALLERGPDGAISYLSVTWDDGTVTGRLETRDLKGAGPDVVSMAVGSISTEHQCKYVFGYHDPVPGTHDGPASLVAQWSRPEATKGKKSSKAASGEPEKPEASKPAFNEFSGRVMFLLRRSVWKQLSAKDRAKLTNPFGPALPTDLKRTAVSVGGSMDRGSPLYSHLDALRSERPALHLVEIPHDTRRCAWCGCCEALPCEKGCKWVSETQCSVCEALDKKAAKKSGKAEDGPALVASTLSRRVLVMRDLDVHVMTNGLKAWNPQKVSGAGSVSGGSSFPLAQIFTPVTDSPDVEKLLTRLNETATPFLDYLDCTTEQRLAASPSLREVREAWNARWPEHAVTIAENADVS